jgi:DNA-binding XRE family transcriptional regulator
MTDKVNIMTEQGADVAQVSLAVANRIRNWRKDKKLSLDELSRRASVSKGMLVEIEKGPPIPVSLSCANWLPRWAFPWRILLTSPANRSCMLLKNRPSRFCGRAQGRFCQITGGYRWPGHD